MHVSERAKEISRLIGFSSAAKSIPSSKRNYFCDGEILSQVLHMNSKISQSLLDSEVRNVFRFE